MKVTDIAPDNAAFFENIVPDGALEDENLFWLGAIAGDGTACAVLGCGICEEMAYIGWIYTDPSYRREGAARFLLKTLKTLLRKIEVRVLQISFSDDDENLEEFLEAEGFFSDEDREIYSVPVKDLIYSTVMDMFAKQHKNIGAAVLLEDFDKPDAFYDYLDKKGIPFRNEEDALCKSLVKLDRDGKIEGCMLICRLQDGDIEISYLMSDGPTGSVVEILLAFKELAVKMDWLDDSIVFTDRSGETIRIIETIASTDRESYIVKKQKSGLITL